MYSYTVMQWLFIFYLYCFLGWCAESAWVSVMSRKLTNRGFLRGPFLPLYGSGGTMMLVVSMPFQDNPVMVYLAGCVGATVLEYVTGVAMEALFKVRYWDYSNRKFNFRGQVCLRSTLAWGGCTILMTQVLHAPIDAFVQSVPGKALDIATGILTVCIAVDFALSFKAAIDLGDVLVRMEQAKAEMVGIHRRLGVILAAANESLGNRRSALAESVSAVKEELAGGVAERIGDVKSGIEGKMESLKTMMLSKPSEYLESVREELLDLKTRYAVQTADRNRLGRLKDFFQRALIRDNPNMKSEQYEESLEELKQSLSKENDR